MTWWKPALGVAIVMAIGIWDVGLPDKQAPPTGLGATSPAPAHTAAADIPGVIQPTSTPEFSATFAGSRLDTSVWATCYPGAPKAGCTNFGNREYEWYLPSQDRVSGGVLHLVAQPTKTPGLTNIGQPKEYACRSGMVTTYPSFKFKYGHVEIVARIPANPGLWSALWLARANGTWPPEIDMLERWGKPTNYAAEYIHPVGAKYSGHYVNPALVAKLSTGWHTFGLTWSRTRLTWYIDGRTMWTVTKYIPKQAMFLILNVADYHPQKSTGGGCSGTMLVRSVKVWRH